MLDLAYQPLSDMLSQDPQTVGGELHFTGTRVPLSTVLDNLAAGETLDRILYNYPTLTRRHLLAVLAWEAELARKSVSSATGVSV